MQTVQVDLAAGEHELEAVAWFITELDGTVGRVGGFEGSAATNGADVMAERIFTLR